MIYIFLYLGAIIAANMIITVYGPAATIITAFIFIGLDLTTRDHLHEAWHGKSLVLKMGLLIGAGSIISYVLNRDAAQIALGSFVAFAGAGTADTVAYHLLKDKSKFIKINGSNVVGSGFDSILFPTIAFGAFMPLIILGQFASKVFGGMLWFWIIEWFKKQFKPSEA